MIKRTLFIISLIFLTGVLVFERNNFNFFNSSTAYAVGDLTFDFGVPFGQPIFTISDMKPGDIQTKTVSATNNATVQRLTAVKGFKNSETGSLGDALNITISENGKALYGTGSKTGTKTLTDFFNDSSQTEGISLTALKPTNSTNYIFMVSFNSASGHQFQEKNLNFDIKMGLSVPIPDECTSMTFDNVIFGTQGNDTLRGTNSRDLIFGLEGNDTISGLDGNDCLVGGDGRNTIVGGKGDDLIFGGNDRDVIRGDDGDDQIWGGEGNDTINGGNGNDVIRGGDGDDRLSGGGGDDTLIGGPGIDRANGNAGTDTCSAEIRSSCEITST